MYIFYQTDKYYLSVMSLIRMSHHEKWQKKKSVLKMKWLKTNFRQNREQKMHLSQNNKYDFIQSNS